MSAVFFWGGGGGGEVIGESLNLLGVAIGLLSLQSEDASECL